MIWLATEPLNSAFVRSVGRRVVLQHTVDRRASLRSSRRPARSSRTRRRRRGSATLASNACDRDGVGTRAGPSCRRSPRPSAAATPVSAKVIVDGVADLHVRSPWPRRPATATSCTTELGDVHRTSRRARCSARRWSGSNADTLFALPPTVASTNRSAVTEPVSGSASMRCGHGRAQPAHAELRRRRSSRSSSPCRSTWPIDARADAANTVMNATSATPIISADAVAAVRRGLRVAFSRASVPAMPRSARQRRSRRSVRTGGR